MMAPHRPSQPELRRAEAATWGSRPTVRRLTLRNWKRVAKGALIGFASISLPIGGADLHIDDLPVLETNGRAWATWPGKPVITAEGTIARIPGTSKPRYVSILHWDDRQTSQRFSQAVVDLVRAKDPDAFDGDSQ